MSDSSTNNRHIARAVQQGAPSPVLSQAGVVKNATGCDNSSLSSRMLPETTSSDLRFPSKNLIRFENISWDIKLANSVQEAKNLGIDILALQEVRRLGEDELTFDSEGIEGWQFVWSGYKRKREAGVAFILAPHVKLVGSHFHYNARILSVRVIIHGLCLSLTCCYAPTDTSSESAKTIFYRELRKANEEMLKFNRYKSIFLGDFNATIGMNSKNSGAWDDVLGANNSSENDTNGNGESFLKFCSEKKFRIVNSFFRTKRIHRGTWLHKPTGTLKRLDYILTRNYISKFISSCRSYRTAASLFDTDHYMVKMTLSYPTTHKKLFTPRLNHRPKSKPIISSLHQDENIAKLYSEQLDSKLDPDCIPSDLDAICDRITSSIQDSIEASCPKSVSVKSAPPWENAELQDMMSKLRKDPNNVALRKNIREKRKELKDQFYSTKASEINNAAEARQVEKEFYLAKNYAMHKKPSSKLEISKEKLTNHFEKHFSERELELPPELVNPENFEYLKDTPIIVNQEPPTPDENEKAVKTFKNNKSWGTDGIPPEGIKYCLSKNLFAYINMLISLIWIHIAVPKSWLELKIVCLYKKGLKSLAENYRALSVGSNLSKLIPRIILNRLLDTYEHNISEAQFGFRKGRSTGDAIFILKNIIQKHSGPLVLVFVDLTAAYDHIPREFLFRILEFRTGAKILVYILRKLYDGTTAFISGTKTHFDILVGCRQGGLESPTLFNYYFDFVLKICSEEIDRKFPDGWGLSFDYRIPGECTNREQRRLKKMHGTEIIKWLLYADDLVLFCPNLSQAQDIIIIMNSVCKRFGLTISFKKTKVMQFNTNTSDISIKVDGIVLDNVSDFCYLGHTIFNDDRNSTELRISKATAKFHELENVLRDHEIHLPIRKKYLEACVRPRLTYGTQSWKPSEEEIKKLDSCWYGFLRRMVKGGFRNKPDIGNDTNFALVYTNEDLLRITKCQPLRDFINIQYLKYTAHVCRRPNTNLTKLSLFMTPKSKHYRDPWIKISQLLGGITVEQAKRETQSKAGFIGLIHKNFTSE